MRILAIDPGTRESAWLELVDGKPTRFAIETNEKVAAWLRVKSALRDLFDLTEAVVIEKVESYGMAVGAEVFETVRWAGRFEEAVQPTKVVLLPRRTVKLALCHDSRAKDANIRQALIDRFGGKDAAIGSKKAPGPLYGITKDVWSALAIAVTYTETLR